MSGSSDPKPLSWSGGSDEARPLRLIWVDDGLFKALSKSTQSTIDPKTGFMYLPCSQFPSFGVSIGGKVFDLNLDDMVYSVTNDGKTSEPLCVVSVQGGLTIRDDPKKPFILLGDTFMKAIYTVSDPYLRRATRNARTDS